VVRIVMAKPINTASTSSRSIAGSKNFPESEKAKPIHATRKADQARWIRRGKPICLSIQLNGKNYALI